MIIILEGALSFLGLGVPPPGPSWGNMIFDRPADDARPRRGTCCCRARSCSSPSWRSTSSATRCARAGGVDDREKKKKKKKKKKTMRPLLQVSDLRVRFEAPPGAPVQAVAGLSYELDGRAGRSRSSASRARARRSARGPSWGCCPTTRGSPAPHGLERHGAARAGRRRDAPPPRGRRRDGLPGSGPFAEPDDARRDPDHRGGPRARGPRTRRPHASGRSSCWGSSGCRRREQRFGEYPHQLSGGMRQRVMIAIALAAQPRLLIADEATTALDVTTQAQIMELLLELQEKLGMALVMISHDLGLAASFADEVIVMYAGRAVEQAPTRELFRNVRMPYTKALLEAIPGSSARRTRCCRSCRAGRRTSRRWGPGARRAALSQRAGGLPRDRRRRWTDGTSRRIATPAGTGARLYPRGLSGRAPGGGGRRGMSTNGGPLLEARGLVQEFTVRGARRREGRRRARRLGRVVRGHAGETLGIVGETGSASRRSRARCCRRRRRRTDR